MKTLEELGISLTPWHAIVRHLFRDIGWVYDKNDRALFGVLLPSQAHLIAAAPDLYEALRECVGEMCKFCKDTEIGKRLPCESGCEIMRRAKAALEKAGGAE